MEVLEQIELELFNDELPFLQPALCNKMDTENKVIRQSEDILLNNHVLPLLRGAGANIDQLQVCVRNINETWMVVEVATLDMCVSMTIWNNESSDYIHYKSKHVTEAYINQYFTSRYKPAQVFYLDKQLERYIRNFFHYKT